MQAFDYHAPTTLDDAARLLSGGDARILAGGTDLVPQVREGRRHVKHVVDVKRIAEMTAITRTSDGGWRIGAATSVGALGRNDAFARAHAGLLDSARLIGSLQVQNRASLGGNLVNAAPSADGVPLLIALGAEAEIIGPAGRRRVPAATIPAGPGRTALAADEILVALILPPRPARSGARYLRFTPRREMDIAVAGAGVYVVLDEDDRIGAARIVLASVGPVPIQATAAAAALVGQPATADILSAAASAAAADARPISDTRGSADYRRSLVATLTRRALEAALREARAA